MADSTRIACLTPPGRGAIAVLAVRGPRAWEVTRSLFQPAAGVLPNAPTPGRFWYGRLGAELRDDVVLAVKQAGEAPWLEVQCHGGPEVVRLLLETYGCHDVATCTWQELEASGLLSALVQAPTTRTAAILLDQHHGAFQRKIASISSSLDQGDVARAATALARLVALAPLAEHLVRPWRVVVAGAPNVGKSSLVNALAGYARCLVSPIPGTTRDLVATTLAIDGWPIELIDTAGQHAATEDLEQAGIVRARRASADADLRLWVVDAAAAPIMPEEGWQLIINKIDLPHAWDLDQCPTALRVSAHTKTGLSELGQALAQHLGPVVPAPGEAVPATPEARALAQRADDLLAAGQPEQVRSILRSFVESASGAA